MKYFFILGCHRSGTTVLQLALNRHSQITIPPETKFFSAFLGHSHGCQIHQLARINRDLGVAIPAPANAVRGNALARHFYARLADAYVDRLGKRNVACFGEKTPAHSGYVPQIRRTIPDAKLIWLYRDGRDVALSMRKVPWLSKDLGVATLIWLFYSRHQLRLARDQTAPVLFVKYEDLVTRPVKELERVTDFLGLKFEPQIALGCGNREGVLEWEYAWKCRAFEPITTSCIGSWRRELLPKEVNIVEMLGGHALRRLGYPLVNASSKRSGVLLAPRLLLEVLRFFRAVRLDEVTNQLFGRAICLRNGVGGLACDSRRFSLNPTK